MITLKTLWFATLDGALAGNIHPSIHPDLPPDLSLLEGNGRRRRFVTYWYNFVMIAMINDHAGTGGVFLEKKRVFVSWLASLMATMVLSGCRGSNIARTKERCSSDRDDNCIFLLLHWSLAQGHSNRSVNGDI